MAGAARVVVLAGPSGSGKSRLAQRLDRGLGLPVLRLDDYYKDGDDPTLPRIVDGPNAGLVDWDDPGSWLPDDAVEALAALCRGDRVEVPVYSIPRNERDGWQTVSLDGSGLVAAEGIFAADVVPALQDAGLLAAAYCLRQHPVVTFWRRLTRDLREHRKPPLVLVRRGLALMRAQRQIVASAVAQGCRPVSADTAYAEISRLRAESGWARP